MAEVDPVARATLFAEAEAALTLTNVYIPFGSPLRFSLVRAGVDGFAGNAWAFIPCRPSPRSPDEPERGAANGIAATAPDGSVDGRDPGAVRQRIELIEHLLERSFVISRDQSPGRPRCDRRARARGRRRARRGARRLHRLGRRITSAVPKWKLCAHGGNVVFDTAIGAVPLAGDLFDSCSARTPAT
jgi:hypothetical protein